MSTINRAQEDKLIPKPEVTKDGNLKPLPDVNALTPGYTPKDDEAKVWTQWRRRKSELLYSRNNVYGLNIDYEMRRFDRMYFARQANIPSSELDPNQRPVAINRSFGKIQTALSILIDRVPKFVLNETNPKYSANRELLRQLCDASFKNTNSLGQLKLFVFNMARRGWAVGRTFNRRLIHDAKFAKGLDAKGRIAYETKKLTKLDDVAFMNISNYNAWLDEQSKPEDFFSTRDWMWREVWYIDDFRQAFPEADFPNVKYVHPGGDTRETLWGNMIQKVPYAGAQGNTPQAQKKGLVEVYFYENQYEDRFIIEANNVMVVWEPLPQNNKRISCMYAPWHFRGDDNIYGIGIIEEMERDEELADRIMNMDMRQLLLTIAPSGFYAGTQDMEDDNLRITPGVLRRTIDPKNINWLQIPQGNNAGLEKIDWLQNQQDQKTGITQAIEGSEDQTDVTAFQVGVEREAGLKRLRLPLKNLQYALEWEFDNRIALIQQVYSDFQVEHLISDHDIQAYRTSIKNDPDFFFTDPKTGNFYAKKFKQVKMNLDKDEAGNFIESDTPDFFHIKPDMLHFEGFVTVDMDSLLVNSDELDQANTLRIANIVIPLLQQPKEVVGPSVKQILTSFNKDYKMWLPADWVKWFDDGMPPPQPQDKLNQLQQQAGVTPSPFGANGVQPLQTITPPSNIQAPPNAIQAQSQALTPKK